MKPISSETKLNFWQLGCILGSALGLPAMIIGGQLAKQYGPGTALTSICIGNCILWLIGLGIISMAEGRNHAIENVKSYLGKYTGIIAALIWVSSFLIWYAIQVQGASESIGQFFQDSGDWKIGVALGLVVALISIGNIKMIKWMCLLALPLLVCLAIYAIIASEIPITFQGTWGFSFPAILSIIFTWLPFSVNLPTIMRYARSRGDAILGLSLKMVLLIFFQTFTILINASDTSSVLFKYPGSNILGDEILTIIFIIFSYVCVNLLNIYFASAGWDTVIRGLRSIYRYFFIGVLGTLGFVIIQEFNDFHLFSYSLLFIAIMLTSFIVNLGLVLLLDFIVRVVVRHRPGTMEKLWSAVCWAVGCIVTISIQIQEPAMTISNVLLMSAVATVISFLIFAFVEETIWSIRKLSRES